MGQLVDGGALDKDAMIRHIVSPNSTFLNEGFYSFWFRFIFKYSYIIEIENYAKLQEIIGRDYSTFSELR